MKIKLKHKIIIILLLVSTIYTAYLLINRNLGIGSLKMHFIDVGQGDSTLIITPNNKSILIDAGDEKSAKKVINYINKQGISKLDIVIGTHPDSDHIGGMDKVVKNFDIGIFAMPKVQTQTSQYKQIKQELKAKNINPKELYMDNEINIDKNLKIEILSPIKGKNYEDTNEHSIVTKIDYKKISFLLMGDATVNNEMDIINSQKNIDVDVLKLGHHGSNTSSSDEFILKTSPRVAIISCGKYNRHGHPHKEVMDTLKKYGVDVYRTDKQGDIVLKTDGKKIISNHNKLKP